VAWLDVCGRLDTTKYGRFVGLSFAGGALLFALVALAPFVMQALISFALLIMCIGLLAFCSSHAPLTNITWHESETASVWVFAKEIEPLFFMFGLSFALVFVYLFNKGGQDVLAGLVAIIPGGVVAAALSMYSKELSITTIERILMVCIVVGDVMLPFASDFFQLVIAVVLVALWAFFMTVNQAFIVKKCVLEGTAPLFRQGPIRLLPAAGGFAVGWAVATVFTHFMDDAQLDMFLYMSLAAAVLIVIVAMVFLPAESHHPVDGSAGAQVTPSANLESDACDHNCAACPTAAIAEELSQKAASTSKDEADMFDLKCQAVAKLYQLSPREAEVLKFLAKGRNASFIQDELTISPHTVKSHIYNIYRKLDIHSQQKLMSFVEEFTI
jgi:DNA-binding CsgD family transcriptional regulator